MLKVFHKNEIKLIGKKKYIYCYQQIVHNDNILALKLYSKLNFQIMRSDINIPELKMKNGYKMVRYKKNVV